MIEFILYTLARAIIGTLQKLPLRCVAFLGRAGGGLVYFADARHRRVATQNLARAFPEKTPVEARLLARENFRRIGENFACAVRTAAMKPEEITAIVSVVGAEKLRARLREGRPESIVFAIGHFGNFELFAHCGQFLPEYKIATTYRGVRQASLNRLLQSLRQKSGCLFFERRTDGEALRNAMNAGNLALGLLADQRGRGLDLPFFGRPCSTSPAVALFALRYDAPIYPAICFRVAAGRWEIHVGDEIPTHENSHPRTSEAIMIDVNRAFESAVRRDPANWFWVHNRWKAVDNRKTKNLRPSPLPAESDA